MAQPVYATPEELAARLGLAEPPPRAEYWLRFASLDVDAALFGVVYATTPDQTPADPTVAAALREATLLQAEMLIEVADPTGARLQWDTVRVGDVSYTRGGGSAGRAGPRGDGRTVAARALQVLRAAGLYPTVRTGWC
ncbi:hypothetical protein GCM10027294_43740 [Marinactinospora endophytica]